jgi:hypothetical protein
MIYGKPITLLYIAWNNTDNEPASGDVDNHDIQWIKSGTPITPENAPLEVDSTVCPGVYSIELTGEEVECYLGCLSGVSTTEGVVIIPALYTFHRLPDAEPGANGGIPTVSADNYIAGIQGTINTLDELDVSGSGGTEMTAVQLTSINASIILNEITFWRELEDNTLELVLSSGVRITLSNQVDKDTLLGLLEGS